MAKQKGNDSGDSSAVARPVKPSGQGYDPSYGPGGNPTGTPRVSSRDTFASIAAAKPVKGAELAYAVGMKRTVTTNAPSYEKGRKEPKGMLG